MAFFRLHLMQPLMQRALHSQHYAAAKHMHALTRRNAEFLHLPWDVYASVEGCQDSNHTHPPTHKHATRTLSYWLRNKTTDEEYNHQGVRNNACQHRAPAAGASLRFGKTTERVHPLFVSAHCYVCALSQVLVLLYI